MEIIRFIADGFRVQELQDARTLRCKASRRFMWKGSIWYPVNPSVAKILNHFDTFLDNKHGGSRVEQAAFSMFSINIVDIILILIRTSREGGSPHFPSSAVLSLPIWRAVDDRSSGHQ